MKRALKKIPVTIRNSLGLTGLASRKSPDSRRSVTRQEGSSVSEGETDPVILDDISIGAQSSAMIMYVLTSDR